MICSEIGTGTSYVNVADETGIVVPPEDSGALRAAMDYLWDNPSIARAMGARARERHRQHFTAGQMTRSYLALYRQLVGRC